MKQIFKIAMAMYMAMFLIACSEDDDSNEDVIAADGIYNFLGTIDGAYYLAASETLTEGSLTFVNNGTQIDADQAARIIASGDYLYSLDYGTGLLSQLQPTATGEYVKIKEINAGLSVGTNTPRYALADESTIIVMNVETTPVTDDAGDVTDYICTLRLSSVAIPEMTIGNLTEFVIPQTENAKKGATIGYHPMRASSPVISGDKIYFGLMHTDIFDPTVPPPFRAPKQSGLETLVFDYPSMTNGTITESSAATGHTGGYRAPAMHVDENGDVYQNNWFMSATGFDLSNGDKTVIMRLRDGAYDSSYEFDVSAALGLESNVAAVGWFYVGNGIGYMPIQLEDEGNYYTDNSWSVARIDIYNQTAVKLDVPLSQLFTYENGITVDDNFYMAISPTGGDAAVYEFDASSAAADAVTEGLGLDGNNIHVEGIYH
ncbi:hypothetical protein BFP72_06560 [Reichenbachiella sp. 5M10]|uniref:DUF4374 domain-containing protein n=1 Tax=Reichenbachiella agariperforans TaxID=156994 RepID=A0A1M6VJL9_REIAG|nr:MULTISPECIES: hypothetical protein [Reichenbachiella]PIB35082.1 hypothetical protein BFP72_06560 [Reichenbachiella sp. 5M10]SHK81690.1 hypothetical protein SAMN04488028_10980 [Reichenbachiella agariperforans]